MIVIPARLVTVGDRAFPVAADKFCNKLPGDVTDQIFSPAQINFIL